MKRMITIKYLFCNIFLLANVLTTQTKVLIFTYSYNKPEFIELQYKTFKKFLLDDHELIVFNDAIEKKKIAQIKDMCNKYDIQCIPVPQEIHNRPYLDRSTDIAHPWSMTEYNAPSVRNSNVTQFSFDSFGFKHDDILILFESDIFLIKEFSFVEYLKNFDLAGYNRQADYQDIRNTRNFLWVGLIFMNMQNLPNKTMFNVNCGFADNVEIDCGGFTYYYINNNSTTRIKYFDKVTMNSYYCDACRRKEKYRCSHNTLQLKNLGFDNKTIDFIQEVPIDWGSGVMRPNGVEGIDRRNLEFFIDNHLVHFNGASGYANGSRMHNFNIKRFYRDKTESFLDYINAILEK